MSNYYEYREVKVLIAHRLMALDGWKVYGYHADESDSMTDYYSPAYWDGVAEKNGYVLCVDVYGASKQKEIREYHYNNSTPQNLNVLDKIQKLEAVTVARGATFHEEKTAKEKIELLKEKSSNVSNQETYTVTGYIPAHMAHPPRMNWHIEKDGKYIAKGNGLLKFSSLYFQRESEKKCTFESLKEGLRDYYNTDEELEKVARYKWEEIQEKAKLANQFDKLITKLDTTCGGLIGDGDLEEYETITVIKYKKEIKAVESDNGSIKEGQCFILKINFNYGYYKGLIYRIHETNYNGKTHYHAYKLNRKLTKECTGYATQNNHWNTFGDKFNEWIEKGAITWVELMEVQTPYEVEKVVKKTSTTKVC